MRHPYLFLLSILTLTVFLWNCQSETEKPPYPLEVKWVQTSVEYQALCEQVYQSAWEAVKAAAPEVGEDWAVVLDIDETVLDNSGYQEIIYKQGKSYPYYWDEWVMSAKCPPTPGVKEFLDKVRNLGEQAHVVFITNRRAHLREATLVNLKALGLWKEGDVLLCKQDSADSKVKRRAEVRQGAGRCEGMGTRKIIALIGDQLADVTAYPEGVAPENYKEHFRNNPEFGRTEFILPNPMYGYWTNGYRQ